MNNELENKLEESATKLLEWTETASTFVGDQVPLYVQELLEWHFYSNLMDCIFMLSLIILVPSLAVLSFLKSGFRKGDADFNVSNLSTVIFGIVTFFVVILCPIELFTSAKECVKVKTAPRVVLVEHFQTVMKK